MKKLIQTVLVLLICSSIISNISAQYFSELYPLDFNSEATAVLSLGNGSHLVGYTKQTLASDYITQTGMMQLDTLGNIIWENNLFNTEEIAGVKGQVKHILPYGDGNFLIGMLVETCEGQMSSYFAKINENGTVVWENTYDATAKSIVLLDDERFAVSNEGNLHFFLPNGTFIYERSYGGGMLEKVYSNGTNIYIASSHGLIKTDLNGNVQDIRNQVQHFKQIIHTEEQITVLTDTEFYVYNFADFSLDNNGAHDLGTFQLFKQIGEQVFAISNNNPQQLLEINNDLTANNTTVFVDYAKINDLDIQDDALVWAGEDQRGVMNNTNMQNSNMWVTKDTYPNAALVATTDLKINGFLSYWGAYAYEHICDGGDQGVFYEGMHVEVENVGTSTISNFSLKAKYDSPCFNACLNSFFFEEKLTGLSLAPGEKMEVLIPEIDILYQVESSTHELCIWISNPNNSEDINAANDAHCEVIELISIPTREAELTRNTLSVFPNPATTQLHFKLEESFSTQSTYRIYNAYGKEILVKQLNPNTFAAAIEIAKFPTGMYILQLENEGKIWQEKFVKQ